MFDLFKRKSRLEKLKIRYRNLMKKSYEIALRDQKRSERVHLEAEKIYKEIQFLIS